MPRKQDLEFEKAERIYRTNLLRILRKEFLIRPPGPSRIQSIDIAAQLRKPATKKKFLAITTPLYNLGQKHATKLIEETKPTTSSAGYLTAAEPSNKHLIDQLTEYSIDSMAYVADDIKPDLITTLQEGYEEGESIPALSKRIKTTWDLNRVRALRFARTFTNEVYNQAHYNRYQDSGVVDGTQFLATIDNRTSDQCRMLNRTIWELNDPAMQRPPLHFFCLAAGTKIQTFDGIKNIEDINVGDMILTHANNYRPATNTMSRMADELIEIKTENKILKITPNHPVLALQDNIYKWIPAGELGEGDEIIISSAP